MQGPPILQSVLFEETGRPFWSQPALRNLLFLRGLLLLVREDPGVRLIRHFAKERQVIPTE